MQIRPAKGTRAVREVFAGPLRITSGPLAATVALANRPAETMLVVVTVGKARVRRAVDRNRIKRVLRHALRSHSVTRPADCSPYVTGMVLVWRSTMPEAGIRMADVRRHMKRLFDKIDAAGQRVPGEDP
ncbi:MAG: ribonuclease P protein component [Candidatus Kapabacteria bacterium]|jgi:ribonuclease P protein component|nr:ribonuclease P protein component [Candidatus Kapabacteria bacterium]